MDRKDLILIIGAGRSGTSALTRVLSLSGCALPDKVLGSMGINPKGCWEPVHIWKINGNFMLRHGTSLADPSFRFQELNLEEREREEYIETIIELLNGCPAAPLLVIKEPNITVLLEFWLEAAHRAMFSPKIIVAIRHPTEVVASFAAWDNTGRSTLSPELGNAFWLKLNLLAERYSRESPRIFVEYANLLKDWRLECTRASKALSIDLQPDEAAIDDFLTHDLYRQKHQGPVTETFGQGWVTRLYTMLSEAARDSPISFPEMDQMYDAYRQSERAFRIGWEEFQSKMDAMKITQQQPEWELEEKYIWRSGRDF